MHWSPVNRKDWVTWKNRSDFVLRPNSNSQIRPKFRLEQGSDQTLKPTIISTSLYLQLADNRHQWCNYRWVVQTYSGMYLCQRTIFWTFNANVYVFAIRRTIKYFWSRD